MNIAILGGHFSVNGNLGLWITNCYGVPGTPLWRHRGVERLRGLILPSILTITVA